MMQMYDCMSESGFVGELASEDDPQGGAEIAFPGVPKEQQSELDAAWQACREAVGSPDVDFSDPAVLRETYEWLHGQYDCLVDAGFDMPAAPSWVTFQDQYATSGAITWDPVGDATSPGTGDRQTHSAALEACPRSTTDW